MDSSVFGIALVALETSLVLEDISHSEVCRCLKYLLFLQQRPPPSHTPPLKHPAFDHPILIQLHSYTSQLSSAPIILVMATTLPSQAHTHDGLSSHSHAFDAAEHGHSHEVLNGPGSYTMREMPIITGRDWNERAFTVGIGG